MPVAEGQQVLSALHIYIHTIIPVARLIIGLSTVHLLGKANEYIHYPSIPSLHPPSRCHLCILLMPKDAGAPPHSFPVSLCLQFSVFCHHLRHLATCFCTYYQITHRSSCSAWPCNAALLKDNCNSKWLFKDDTVRDIASMRLQQAQDNRTKLHRWSQTWQLQPLPWSTVMCISTRHLLCHTIPSTTLHLVSEALNGCSGWCPCLLSLSRLVTKHSC